MSNIKIKVNIPITGLNIVFNVNPPIIIPNFGALIKIEKKAIK
jgi:hypothetical protein